MADYTVRDLRDACLAELNDTDQTNFLDTEMVHYINDAFRFVQNKISQNNMYAGLYEAFPVVDLIYSEFSNANEHDLPVNFMAKIKINRKGIAEPIRETDVETIDNSSSENRCFIYTSHIGAPVPNSSNSGTDDFNTREKYNGYTGGADDTITVTIDSGGSTFSWTSTSNGSGSDVSIEGEWQELASTGIMVYFDDTSGYTSGDSWSFAVYETQRIHRLQLNFDPEENIRLWYEKRYEKVSLSTGELPADTYIPFYQYYDALKMFVILKARNRNEENASQDASLFRPVMDLVLSRASSLHEDDAVTMMPSIRSIDYK